MVKCYYCSKKFIHQNLKTHILSKHGNVTIREKGQKSLKDSFSSRVSEKNDSSTENIKIDVTVDTEHIKKVNNFKSYTSCDIDNFGNASSCSTDPKPHSMDIDIPTNMYGTLII